jgi:hypothetical protein
MGSRQAWTPTADPTSSGRETCAWDCRTPPIPTRAELRSEQPQRLQQ